MDIADKIEEIFDIKLFDYQKQLIRLLDKGEPPYDKFIIPIGYQCFDWRILLTTIYELYKEELNK